MITLLQYLMRISVIEKEGFFTYKCVMIASIFYHIFVHCCKSRLLCFLRPAMPGCLICVQSGCFLLFPSYAVEAIWFDSESVSPFHHYTGMFSASVRGLTRHFKSAGELRQAFRHKSLLPPKSAQLQLLPACKNDGFHKTSSSALLCSYRPPTDQSWLSESFRLNNMVAFQPKLRKIFALARITVHIFCDCLNHGINPRSICLCRWQRTCTALGLRSTVLRYWGSRHTPKFVLVTAGCRFCVRECVWRNWYRHLCVPASKMDKGVTNRQGANDKPGRLDTPTWPADVM